MSADWRPFAYRASVDLAKAHLARNEAEILQDLKDALENLGKAIDALENARK